MLALCMTCGALVCSGLYESIRHRQRLSAIPLRIHVNGTRGKSSVTRLITAGLQACGFCTMGKTTGTEARLILPTGIEIPFRRKRWAGPPSIIEQRRLVKNAARLHVEVLVSECMAIRPEIQHVAERSYMRSSLAVFTNVKLDHTDVMGKDRPGIAQTMALGVPAKGKVVLGPSCADLLPVFEQQAVKRQSSITLACMDNRLQEIASSFPHNTVPENICTALAVCDILHLPRERFIEGMRKRTPDPGEFSVTMATLAGKRWYFVDAFAANEAESTLLIWRKFREWQCLRRLPVVGLLNNRNDRAFRIEDMAYNFVAKLSAEHSGYGAYEEYDKHDLMAQSKEATRTTNKPGHYAPKAIIPSMSAASDSALSRERGINCLAIIGEGLLSARLIMRKASSVKILVPSYLSQPTIPGLLETLALDLPWTDGVVLFGFGNTKGAGNRVRAWFAHHGQPVNGTL